MSPTKKKGRRGSHDVKAWARRATVGIDQSGTMIGILDWDKQDRNSEQYWRFAVQLGRCLLDGKPLLLIVPRGTEVPERLQAAAAAVEYYIAGNEASVTAACTRAFAAIGIVVKH